MLHVSRKVREHLEPKSQQLNEIMQVIQIELYSYVYTILIPGTRMVLIIGDGMFLVWPHTLECRHLDAGYIDQNLPQSLLTFECLQGMCSLSAQ